VWFETNRINELIALWNLVSDGRKCLPWRSYQIGGKGKERIIHSPTDHGHLRYEQC
jgi:hypothetical protein